ncbi:hypothetical protein ZIOFF_047928 [Zingiber officinale]|uniref:Proteasomal ATPase second OB domain-containing protein n=1 Tax=Zingiber officinale TaxID=94328 RepID=A0A8J5FYT6_ZINOF|nr:hypothetical protein ZIOFF_047928 [Zingiber officinale]
MATHSEVRVSCGGQWQHKGKKAWLPTLGQRVLGHRRRLECRRGEGVGTRGAPTLHEEKNEEDRSKVDDLRGSPMSIRNIKELMDENHAIVSSSVGLEYYVGILSLVDKDQLELGCAILMHNKVVERPETEKPYGSLDLLSVVGILQDEVDPMVSVMKVEKAPLESYVDIGGLDAQIQENKEVVELPLTHPELYKDIGIRPPKGSAYPSSPSFSPVVEYGGAGTTESAPASVGKIELEFEFKKFWEEFCSSRSEKVVRRRGGSCSIKPQCLLDIKPEVELQRRLSNEGLDEHDDDDVKFIEKDSALQVLHNIVVAEYFRDGCTDPRNLLDALNKEQSEELTHTFVDQIDSENSCLGYMVSGSKANSASIHQSGSINSSRVQIALRVCLLLLDVALACEDILQVSFYKVSVWLKEQS